MSLLIAILTCNKNKHKQQAVRDTWLKDVAGCGYTAIFLEGDPTLKKPRLRGDILTVPAKDDYESLSNKMLAFWKWAVDQDYKSIFKCDDDTYVCVPRLRHIPPRAYIGRVIEKPNRPRFCSGGAGYRLRKWYLRDFIKAYEKIRPTGAEDVVTANALLAINIRPQHSPLLRMNNRLQPSPVNRLVSCHYVDPDGMREIHRKFAGTTTP